jgi:hypothetical protein
MVMKLCSIILVSVLMALLISGCASTQDQKAMADRDALCSVLDTNHDGKISKEEFMARTNDKNKGLEVYQKCDVGHKGYLTYDEVWENRLMLPPELIITTPPVLTPGR